MKLTCNLVYKTNNYLPMWNFGYSSTSWFLVTNDFELGLPITTEKSMYNYSIYSEFLNADCLKQPLLNGHLELENILEYTVFG